MSLIKDLFVSDLTYVLTMSLFKHLIGNIISHEFTIYFLPQLKISDLVFSKKKKKFRLG